MTRILNTDDGERLAEIHVKIKELLDEARGLVRHTSEYAAADGYWLAHIETALGGGRYPTYSTTMLDTIKEVTTLEFDDYDWAWNPRECEGCCAVLTADNSSDDPEVCDRCLSDIQNS